MADDATRPSGDTDKDDQMHGLLARAMREADARPSFSMEPLDAAIEARGGDVLRTGRQQREESERSRAEHQREKDRLDSLPLEDLKAETIMALEATAALLSETRLDSELRTHGWSERLISLLGEHCSELKTWVSEGTYSAQREGPPLGRWVIEEIDPRATDELNVAVYRAGDLLAAFPRRQQAPPSERSGGD
jgi:hypothetical protein